MIVDRGIIKISPGIEYITQWVDENGQYIISRYLSSGKQIINKSVTGCGFTTYCLLNNENVILISPRITLIKNKIEQINKPKNKLLFYFDRELSPSSKKKSDKKTEKLIEDLFNYCTKCVKTNTPIKLLVTYDSFSILATILEKDFGYDISNNFRLVIDESHTLIKDIKLKEYSNKCVLSNFIRNLFHYSNLLFITATPIIEYISQIPEFMANKVEYIELAWDNIAPVNTRKFGCKNPVDAFDKIYSNYIKHKDSSGRLYFDAIYYGNSESAYSYEAVIFLNSVLDIKRIVNKYVNKLGCINVSDITIICANSAENRSILKKTNENLEITTSIPKEGDPHTVWTFVTRTAFEGVDFYSPCASTFIIANYNVECLSLDIASDIPQIIGRQRLKTNPFRNTLNIFYTNNVSIISEEAFQEYRKRKMEYSQMQMDVWRETKDNLKDIALTNLTCTINTYPNDLYLKTINGYPEIDNLIILSENYSRDVQRNHQTWYSIQPAEPVINMLGQKINELKAKLDDIEGEKKTRDRIRLVLDYVLKYSELKIGILKMLSETHYGDIARYFNDLPLDKISALGCDPWKLDQEMKNLTDKKDLHELVELVFERGETYLVKDVKWMLQEIYDRAGILKVAKATDLPSYISCKAVQKNKRKAYKIL